MKVYSLLLIFAVISGIKSDLEGFSLKLCENYRPGRNEAFSRDFCRSLAFQGDYYQCCYLKYKTSEGTYHHCYPLTLAQFYDIDSAKDAIKNANTSITEIKSLECTSSNYLYGSFLLLLFILF